MTSNRHWPSLFKLKPSTCQNQWHQITTSANLSSNEGPQRTPEPKPRWNPKPEQIRILESIFNSGMVNPSREEIPKIRMQLEQYGELGDASVYYWFRNKISRSKQRQRHLQASTKKSSKSSSESGVSSSNVSSFTIFIDNTPFDVPMGPINVKALFGPNVVLFNSYGQPVLMDEHGFALQALQQGAMYYLMQI